MVALNFAQFCFYSCQSPAGKVHENLPVYSSLISNIEEKLLFACLSVHLSVHFPVCLSVCVSVHTFVSLFVSLSKVLKLLLKSLKN